VAGPLRYLRQDAVVEPLFDRWYLRLWLVSPANAAVTVANQVALMRSFVDGKTEPSEYGRLLNLRAIPLDRSHVPEVAAMLRDTESKRKPLIELSAALHALDDLVVEHGGGYGYEQVYERLPESLRGFVELEYDNNGYPHPRLLEGLLYRSRFYDKSAQSVELFRCQPGKRPFVLNTPRLVQPDAVPVKLPIESPAHDRLAEARFSPVSVPALADELGLDASQAQRFDGLFTEQAPPAGQTYRGPGMRVRYFGHSTLLFEWQGASIITDPGVGPYVDGVNDRFTYADLPPRIDYAVITHGHWDHLNLECLLQLRHRIGTVVVPRSSGGCFVDPSLKLALQNLGFRNVVALDEMESLPLPDGEIVGVPFFGEHADQEIRSKLCYLVRHRKRQVLIAADTRALEPRTYHHVQKAVGDIDALFISMEVVGPPLLYGAVHYLGRRALDAHLADPAMRDSRNYHNSGATHVEWMIDALHPKMLFIYSMALEPWMSHLLGLKEDDEESPELRASRELVAACQKRGLTAERLFMKKELVLE
jgi:L-ascorbate metabolism protein UlaG (beta-lactamase superfamily)